MDFSGMGMSQTWGSVINGVAQKKNSWDSQSRIDVGQIMENIQRENYMRHQRSIEKSEFVSNSVMNWKKEDDSDMKSLESKMESLKKRKEEIRQNSTEMTILASQLRQKLSKVREMKRENQLFHGDEEQMQTS